MSDNPLQQEANPLLGKVKLPGRVFQLPSKGAFYQSGVLAAHVIDGEVQVKPMSALAEVKIRSADLLYSGKIIRELCQECVPEILRPEVLVTKDVDALFTFLRVSTYGTKIDTTVAHDCEHAKTHAHQIDLDPILSNPRNSVLAHKETLYRIELSNGQVVHGKPPTYQDAMNVAQQRMAITKIERTGGDPDEGLLIRMMIDDMLAIIASVETDTLKGDRVVVTRQDHIEEWLKSISKTVQLELFEGIKKADEWGFDFSTDIVCKDCGATYRYKMELDPINFFFG